jgi:MiaB/RimO family radical SAM methylthiotransferase
VNGKAFFTSMGCERRGLDAERCKEFFRQNRWEVTYNCEDADLLFVFTCGFDGDREDKSIDKIIELDKSKKENAELIVCGCLPKINKKEIDEVFSGRIIHTTNLEDVEKIIKSKTRFSEIPDSNIIEEHVSTHTIKEKISRFVKKFELTKSFFKRLIDEVRVDYNRFIKRKIDDYENPFIIRVSQGCTSNCSYCGIKKAVGPFKSKPQEVVMQELRKGIDEGYSNISILADDTGAYGIDIETDFPTLIKNLVEEDGDYRMWIQEVNPQWMIKYQNDLNGIMNSEKIDKITIPIQSGSQRILDLMQRYYDIEKVSKCINEIHKTNPKLRLETQIIIGFPTETEKDFEKTKNILTKLPFEIVRVYKFDPKTGTKAAEMKDQIPQQVIEKRFIQLTDMLGARYRP